MSYTSVLRIPNLKSVFRVILSFSSASLTVSTKLGHPDPESNFFLLEKRAVPQHTQLYTPGSSMGIVIVCGFLADIVIELISSPFSLLSLYLPVHARSVPPPLATYMMFSIEGKMGTSDLLLLTVVQRSFSFLITYLLFIFPGLPFFPFISNAPLFSFSCSPRTLFHPPNHLKCPPGIERWIEAVSILLQ